MYFISPTQINALAPDSAQWGSLQVRTPQGASDWVAVQRKTVSPAFLPFEAEGRNYAAAVHADGTYLGKTGLIPGLTTRPAKPGDAILLFGTGLDPPIQPRLRGKSSARPRVSRRVSPFVSAT